MQRSPTDAPPPTPCANGVEPSYHDPSDVLSSLLLRLPPNLVSIPSRRSSAPTSPPVISFAAQPPLLSPATPLGYFQLVDHPIPAALARSAESQSQALFQLTEELKETWFPQSWPLGYEAAREDRPASFCLDSDCTVVTSELEMSDLREFTLALERVGMELVDRLAKALGLERPTEVQPLMWVCQGAHLGEEPPYADRFYPYFLGLQYQTAKRKLWLLSDSDWINVSPREDSLLVTIGDIAQVWSNGKLKKVRGRAVALQEEGEDAAHGVTMTLLLTLPMDSVVRPQPTLREEEEEKMEFDAFYFKDYAWRVYRQRLPFADPLENHRRK